jgi:hypothetical protein
VKVHAAASTQICNEFSVSEPVHQECVPQIQPLEKW